MKADGFGRLHMAATRCDVGTMEEFKAAFKALELKTKQLEFPIKVSILCLVYVLTFVARSFSVLHYESTIHEFDPYFNY